MGRLQNLIIIIILLLYIYMPYSKMFNSGQGPFGCICQTNHLNNHFASITHTLLPNNWYSGHYVTVYISHNPILGTRHKPALELLWFKRGMFVCSPHVWLGFLHVCINKNQESDSINPVKRIKTYVLPFKVPLYITSYQGFSSHES